eukprot:468570-Prymnesium_polylepis.1
MQGDHVVTSIDNGEHELVECSRHELERFKSRSDYSIVVAVLKEFNVKILRLWRLEENAIYGYQH